MPRRALKLAPRMGLLALSFAAPVAAANLAAVDLVDPVDHAERTLPRERPGAVVRGEGGVIDERDAIRLDPTLELSLLGQVDATPAYWPTQITRYRFATVSQGLLPLRPQDTSGLLGGLSHDSEDGLGLSSENEYALGGYYGWKLTPNTTLQGDLQYVHPGELGARSDTDSVVLGLNLHIEF